MPITAHALLTGTVSAVDPANRRIVVAGLEILVARDPLPGVQDLVVVDATADIHGAWVGELRHAFAVTAAAARLNPSSRPSPNTAGLPAVSSAPADKALPPGASTRPLSKSTRSARFGTFRSSSSDPTQPPAPTAQSQPPFNPSAADRDLKF